MIRAIWPVLLLAVVSHGSAAQPEEFRFHKDIHEDIDRRDGDRDRESILAVALDADVYAATRNGFPDLRIFDAAGHETPFLLEGVAETLGPGEKKVDYPIKMSRVEEDAAKKTTTVYISSRREPLTELTLETTSRNFSRAVVVEAPAAEGIHTRWTTIAHGQVSLLEMGDFHRETLGVSFPEQRHSEYRIVIQNEDNPPLAITGIKSRGNQYRVVFLAAAKQTYRLDYGSEEVEPPKYDAAAVLGPLRLRGDRPSDAVLGPQIANAAAEPPAVTAHRLINSPWFMGAVIVALVVVLAWALFRATRRIEQIPKE